MIKNISVAVLTKNNEDTITNTLNSLIEFEDVVVYDNGSKDKTMEIAKKFPNMIQKGNPSQYTNRINSNHSETYQGQTSKEKKLLKQPKKKNTLHYGKTV